MTARVPWDRYEVALLFSAYERVAQGADINREAEKLSETLRTLAVRRSVAIDETYRNVNGMKMQLANVQYLFTDGKRGLSGASLMIRQMYELYRDTPAEYQKILKEANRMTGITALSVEDAFFAYAKDKIGLPPTMLTAYLKKAESYCHLKQSLLGMTDVRTVRNVQQKVATGKLLRFRYGKDAQTIRTVTQLYYAFIKGYHEPEEELPTRETFVEKENDIPTGSASVVNTTGGESAPKPQTTVIAEIGEEIVDESNITELNKKSAEQPDADQIQKDFGQDEGYQAPEAKQHREMDVMEQLSEDANYDWQRKGLLLVDLTGEATYAFTQPEAYEYKGVTRRVNKWGKLYADLCCELFNDYRDVFMSIMNGDIPGYNALSFADEQHKSGMRVARCFAPGFYLESNISATTTVRKICGLYQLFNLGDSLRISYIKLEDSKTGDSKTVEVPTELDEEWLIHQLNTKNIPYVDNRSTDGCLWIASDMSIPIPLNEAADRGYRFRFKQDGCRAFPNRPVIWTKDQPKRPAQPKHVIPIGDAQKSLNAFERFLSMGKGYAERTARNYCASIRMIEEYIQQNHIDFSLLNADASEAQRISDLLMARQDFENINNQRHHQFSAALAQYVLFLRQGGYITSDEDQKQPGQKTIIETVFDVLRQARKPMTVSEIYQVIIRNHLYPFGAQDPQSVVYSKISLACKQTDTRIKQGRDVLIPFEENGRKVFQVMSAEKAAIYLEHQERKSELQTASPWAEYETVLVQAFPKGFQKESGLDMKKLRKRWEEINGRELKDSDETIRLQIAAHCVDTGKRWYLAELLLSDADRRTVLQYIDRILGSGKPVLYYTSIYAALEHQLESTVLTEDLLTSYLLATCRDRYILHEHYLSNDRHAQANLYEEMKEVMLAHGCPIHTDELKRELHHLPPDQVERELHSHPEFIKDAMHMYFHESMVDLTDQELNQIASLIQDELDDQGYMIGNNIQKKLKQSHPEIADRLSFLTPLGVRGAMAYKLRAHFTFSETVITPRGKAMNMRDIFAMFCQHHSSFTLDELSDFAKECNSTIYMDTIRENCVRVNENDFVAIGTVHWDIPHIDAAIALYCPGKYVSLKNIQYFDAFPFIGYPWNSYLLEQYVATVSKNFMLMHSSYAKNTTSGVIVRRDAGFESFDEVLADVLAKAPINLEKDSCLEYLANGGYITRKKISNINEMIMRAKLLRSRKG